MRTQQRYSILPDTQSFAVTPCPSPLRAAWLQKECHAEDEGVRPYRQLVLQCKVDAIKGYGGIITPCAPTMEARESTAAEVEQRTGAAFIPPYNYGPTICGQGTIALEFLQQASPDQTINKVSMSASRGKMYCARSSSASGVSVVHYAHASG